MKQIKIVTDSTAYMAKQDALLNDIDIVQLSISFGDESFEEGYPGEFETFYKKLESSDKFPTTSQPAIGSFISMFEKAIEEDKEVIAIILSSKISGAYNGALTAANMVNSEKITVIDSENTVSNLRMLVERATELVNLGKTRHEIEEIINKEKKNMQTNIAIETLEYLRRGGRLTGMQAFAGKMLQIKPIVALKDGELISIDKVRGTKKAIKKIINNIPKRAKNISIMHIMNEDGARKIKETIEDDFREAKITISEVGPVLGSHLGPKSLGICCTW